MNQEIVQNVVIFGETGAGKSSLVNMILGRDEAKISGDITGCTFDSTVYNVVIKGRSYNLHDTIGLGDHSNSHLDVTKPIGNLYNLLTLLSKTGGIHLLIFVVRCGRLTQTVHKNYTLFYQGFCDAQVPIVVVVTGCEDVEPRMETWWTRNEYFFTRAGMRFKGHACICASKGRETAYGYVNEDLVEESKGLVDDLIFRYCESNGMKKEPNDWIHTIWGFVDLFRSRGILGNILTPPARELYHTPTNSTNTHQGASPPPIEVQLDGKFVPIMGDMLISPEAQDSSAALPLSNSSIEDQNALQSGVHTHTSLQPLPSQEGIPCSTMATSVKVGQYTISSSSVSSIEPQNAQQKLSTALDEPGRPTNSAMASVAEAETPIPVVISDIEPENENTAMSYPPCSIPTTQDTLSSPNVSSGDSVTLYTDPQNVCENTSNPLPPSESSPKMTGACIPFPTLPTDAPAQCHSKLRQVCQSNPHQTPSSPPKMQSNLCSRTSSSSDAASLLSVSTLRSARLDQNHSNIGPAPEAQSGPSSSPSVRSVVPSNIDQCNPNSSLVLCQPKEQSAMRSSLISLKAETVAPAPSVSNLEPQNIYQSHSAINPSPTLQIKPGLMANSVVAALVGVWRRAGQCRLQEDIDE